MAKHQHQPSKHNSGSDNSAENPAENDAQNVEQPVFNTPALTLELQEKIQKCKESNKQLETEGTDYLEEVKHQLQAVDGVVQKLKYQLKEISRLKHQLKKRQLERQQQQKLTKRRGKKGDGVGSDIKEAEAADAEMMRALVEEEKGVKATLRAISPTAGGKIAQWFIGSVNLKLYGENEKFLMKSRYENFKIHSIVPFVALITFYALCPSYYISKFLLHAWSLLYFSSLILRENILCANGSNIRNWWIVHHYISLFTSFVFLIWPESSTQFQQFRIYYLAYVIYLVIIQYLQSKYQLGRLYNLVALGKAGDMDVTGEVPTPAMEVGLSSSSSSSAPGIGGSHPRGPFFNLDIVYPFITFGHLYQLFNAYKLIRIAYENGFTEWQAYVGAVSFGILGLCNLTATTKVYFGKKKRKTN